jgi:hypothetical protein
MSTNTEAFRGSMNLAQSIRRYAGVLPLALALLAGGCDTGPATLTPVEPQNKPPKTSFSMASIMEGPYHADAVVTCNIIVATLKFRCVSPQDPNPLVPAPIGGKGVFVRLLPSNMAYVPDSSIFRANVRVLNQLLQRIGTTDGTTVTGMKAFFVLQPTVTQGTGTVTIANADGTAEFTAPGQPYFVYNQIRKSVEQTALKNWKFNVPATVAKFQFKIYVSTNILPMVVFDMSQGGNRDIYRANIDGTDLVQLTNHAAADVSPTVAQDRVVFTSYRDGNAELYSMALLGGAQTRLTNTLWNETDPVLSFNNVHLTYMSTESGERRVWYGPATMATRTQIPLFNTPASIQSRPAWESNGSKLIYGSTDQGVMNLYRLTVATGVRTQLIGSTNVLRFEPRLSQDYKKVAFVFPLKTDPANSEIYVLDTPSGVVTRVTNRAPADIQPTFLHDGRVAWLLYTTPTDWRLRWSTIDGLSKSRSSRASTRCRLNGSISSTIGMFVPVRSPTPGSSGAEGDVPSSKLPCWSTAPRCRRWALPKIFHPAAGGTFCGAFGCVVSPIRSTTSPQARRWKQRNGSRESCDEHPDSLIASRADGVTRATSGCKTAMKLSWTAR